MAFWIVLTLFAAFFQNLRSALQKNLSHDLGANASAYTRFLFALPFALIYALVIFNIEKTPVTGINNLFFLIVCAGGTAQIMGTSLLIRSFAQNRFAQGTAYSKTEVLQTAILGFFLMGEAASLPLFIGIFVSLGGVVGLVTAGAGKTRQTHMSTRTLLTGIAAGTGFAVSALAYRAASLTLNPELSAMQAAAVTLLCVLCFQAVAMGLYFVFTDQRKLALVFAQWRSGLQVGLAGMLASAGWFTALAMQNAAYVRALGQVELIFAILTSILIFKEKLHLREFISMLVLVLGILVIVLGA